ncbi:MAG: sulfatase [Bacteroidales bacterium]|nr:sulfatase [Bacteroidales bacterium]
MFGFRHILILAWVIFCVPTLFAAEPPRNVVMLLADDWRWDTLGCAPNPIVQTPHLDALARDGIRFTQCRVTTSICMVSRASILTGQHMARHGIDRFGKPITPEAWAETYPAQLRAAGYHIGFVGKFGVGKPRETDFDFLRSYEGRHWLPDRAGGQIHITEKNARDALDYLKVRPKNRPFCLSVSFFATHAEDRAKLQYLPQDWSEKFYKDVRVPVPALATATALQALPPFLQSEKNEGRIRWHWRFDTPERFQEYMIRYYRMATEVDEAVGRMVAELKKQGVYENTLIVFAGDNGYFHAERGLADKWYPYEEALRVPLIVHDPRLSANRRGRTHEALALNIDIAPTLLAAAGVTVPTRMQGADLAPLYLADSSPNWRQEFYYQHPTITSQERIPATEGVIRRDWKYILYPEWKYEQLLDLSTDPQELKNLVANDSSRAQLAHARQQLSAWRTRVR